MAIKSINWNIVGFSETKRAKETIQEHTEFILYQISGSNGRNGVEFIVKKQLKDNSVSFKSFSGRVATLKLKISKSMTWAFVVRYTPTEKYPIEDVESFYETVETAFDYV